MMDKNRMKYSIGVYSPKPQVKNDVCSVLHTNRYAYMHYFVAFL